MKIIVSILILSAWATVALPGEYDGPMSATLTAHPSFSMLRDWELHITDTNAFLKLHMGSTNVNGSWQSRWDTRPLHVTSNEIAEFRRQIQGVDYFHLPDTFGTQAVDASSRSILISFGERSKEVSILTFDPDWTRPGRENPEALAAVVPLLKAWNFAERWNTGINILDFRQQDQTIIGIVEKRDSTN